MPVLIGTSGWQYRHWRETFYPRGVTQGAWLEFYAQRFQTVESNNAFYRLPEAATFAAWARRTPDDFVMAVKVSRYLTHIKRLAEPAEPVERFVRHVSQLGSKLGPVLLQLPPSLRMDIERLRGTLDEFPPTMRVAVEFRHDSWYTPEVRDLLTERAVALCLADRRRRLTPVWRTADWAYVRFHEGRAVPSPCYGRTSLKTWVETIADRWPAAADVFVYFNNDPRACALRDAGVFARASRRAGLAPTRVAPPRDVHVAVGS